MADDTARFTNDEALRFHSDGKPGKLEITPTKPMATQRDLSLAYSPGVAAPVRAIYEQPSLSYEYTARGNMVAVISNGTAILGLGNLGPLASKPVMEGKAVLFKRFADVDSIDLELDAPDPDSFVDAVKVMGPSFGGINLEDIKSPECFIIEARLREMMDIPVFHDDQHGTAIICAAGIINALNLAGKRIEDVKVVLNGAGAAGVACIKLIKAMGLPHENAVLLDIDGVLHTGRDDLDEWRAAHALDTPHRTLADAIKGADVFIGLSVANVLTPEMLASMNERPIVFAMANPEPEIHPDLARTTRPDAIVATGRSDYPNQVNNVLGFPYIFRGALDVRARTINDEMKIAAARAIAELAREDVPDEVAEAYGRRLQYGPNYIIPAPFDPRLIHHVPVAVAKAAMDSGVARHPIIDLEAYGQRLRARLDPTASMLQLLHDRARILNKRVVFAEGEDESVLRAATAFVRSGLGRPVLIGREEAVRETLARIGLPEVDMEVVNARLNADKVAEYTEMLYVRLRRKGFLWRDCERLVQQDRNIFGALMLAAGDVDGMVTGVTRKTAVALDSVRRVIDGRGGAEPVGVSAVIARGRTVLVADTLVHDMPSGEEIAHISKRAAAAARKLGMEPRVALLSFSTFGYPPSERNDRIREAVALMERDRDIDFEFDGEIGADVALDMAVMASYPFCRLTGPANVLVMPARHSASISTKLLAKLGGATLIGPITVGLERPVQFAGLNAGVSEILNMAVMAACAFE